MKKLVEVCKDLLKAIDNNPKATVPLDVALALMLIKDTLKNIK